MCVRVCMHVCTCTCVYVMCVCAHVLRCAAVLCTKFTYVCVHVCRMCLCAGVCPPCLPSRQCPQHEGGRGPLPRWGTRWAEGLLREPLVCGRPVREPGTGQRKRCTPQARPPAPELPTPPRKGRLATPHITWPLIRRAPLLGGSAESPGPAHSTPEHPPGGRASERPS